MCSYLHSKKFTSVIIVPSGNPNVFSNEILFYKSYLLILYSYKPQLIYNVAVMLKSEVANFTGIHVTHMYKGVGIGAPAGPTIILAKMIYFFFY